MTSTARSAGLVSADSSVQPGSSERANVDVDPATEPPPESGIQARTVLVALRAGRVHPGVIGMARLLARVFRAPLHGLFAGAEPIAASEVPAHIGVTPEALQGVVLDVVVSQDPAGALAAAAESLSTAFVVVPSAPEELRDEHLGVSMLAARALQAAACGVVIMSPTSPEPRLQRILLPLDGTPSTAAAITPVGELSRRLGAELDIVLVGDAAPRARATPSGAHPVSTPAPLEPGAMVPPLYMDQPHHEWAAFEREFIDRFLAIGHCPTDVPTRFFFGAGDPAAEILRLATELGSDLLVLVWHGQLEDHHGSVFCDVLRNASCPVLVLRR